MRTTISLGLALTAAIAALTALPGKASAQNAAFCAVAGGRGGYENCGYYTFQQCREAVSGVGGYCVRNPRHVERSYPDEPPPPRYQRRDR